LALVPIWFAARLGTAFLMLATTAYAGLVVSQQIARVQSAIGGAPSSPSTNRYAAGYVRSTAWVVDRP
jgi:hypothetical protein